MIRYTLLLLSSCFFLSDSWSQVPEKPYENSHFLMVDSVFIHFRTWNDDLAAPRGNVLLIHGFCGSTFCWRNNYDTLVKARYRIIAIDLPGFGYSERSATLNQSQSYRARLIWDLLTKIDGTDTVKWNVIGHSMGGGTAEAVALMQPKRIQSLIIVAGMVFINNNNVNGVISNLVNTEFYKKLLLSYTENKYLTFDHFRKQLKGTYGYMPDTNVVNGYLKPLLIEGSAETVVNLIANSKEIQPLHAEDLDQLPVMVVWGEKDRTIPERAGKKLKKAVPRIELRTIPYARHMVMETHAELFNSLMVEFLNRNNGPAR